MSIIDLKNKFIGDHGKPFIDKITITGPSFNKVYKGSIHSGGTKDYDAEVLHFAKEGAGLKDHTKSASFGRYKFATQICLENSVATALLQIGPKNPAKNPFVRLEFNPNKLGPEGISALNIELGHFFLDEGPQYLSDHGNVSRLDVAIDFHDTSVSQFCFLNSWGTTSQLVFSPKGELETIYWGKSKSAGQTKIYNKAKEAKLPDDFQITRIERMLKSNLQLKSIADLKFPFSHLTATAEMPPKPPGFDKKQWEMFSDSVKVRGHAAAIQLLSKTKRKKVVKWSAENASPLWQPEELWKEWSQTAELFLERLLWTPHKS